ncbi:MAG: hypothetical protein JRM97_04875 [Nitrososphaerota archaeon]|nr:hypothetical protein [Nitrososphaerota archaeon]MDG6970310.1 hypothetical protein [Nitrososphaerota archaeon]MDG6986823.1 hypothetical protein [Nitrososphaerota archaeon]MDG7031941.1 hypothetical protein [Nitrososphaerota archaeon]
MFKLPPELGLMFIVGSRRVTTGEAGTDRERLHPEQTKRPKRKRAANAPLELDIDVDIKRNR